MVVQPNASHCYSSKIHSKSNHQIADGLLEPSGSILGLRTRTVDQGELRFTHLPFLTLQVYLQFKRNRKLLLRRECKVIVRS